MYAVCHQISNEKTSEIYASMIVDSTRDTEMVTQRCGRQKLLGLSSCRIGPESRILLDITQLPLPRTIWTRTHMPNMRISGPTLESKGLDLHS